MPSTRTLLTLVVSMLVGCVQMSVQRTGERFASYPENCVLDFQYGDTSKAFQLASTGYVQVGSISVVKGGDSFDDAMKDRVRPEACKLGGNVVIMAGSSEGSWTTNYSYVSLMVFRNTSPSSASN